MTTPDTSQFVDGLRQQLVDGADRLARRRHRRRSAALASFMIIIVGAAGIAIQGLRPSPAAADVRVTVAGDFITLRLTGQHVTARDIDRAAAAAGLNVTSSDVPVGPSREGKIIRAASDQQLPMSFALIGDDGAFTGFRMPTSWRGSLRVDFGRSAKRGEIYVYASDAFAAGEPLACSGAFGRPIADVRDRLEGLGYTTSIVSGRSGIPAPGDEAHVVGDAEVTSATHVRLNAIGPADPPIRREPPAEC